MKKIILLILVALYSHNIHAQLVYNNPIGDFYFNIFDEMQTDNPNENIVYCPFNTLICVDMLLNGMDDESQRKVLDAMGVGDLTIEDFNSIVKKLYNGLYTYGDGFSTSIYPYFARGDNAELEEDYREYIKSMDIPELRSVSDDKIFVGSSVYYEDMWARKPTEYEKDIFTNADGKSVKLNFIQNLIGLYYTFNDFDIVRINFNQIDNGPYSFHIRMHPYSMFCIIPRDDSGKSIKMDSDIMIKMFLAAITDGKPCMISMPKIYAEDSLCIDSYFEKVTGINLQSDLSLTKVVKNKTLSVPSITDYVNIELNESGIDASYRQKKIKNMNTTNTSKKEDKKIVINKPFNFIIMDNSEYEILLTGCVRNLEGEEVNMTAINPVNVSEKSSNEIYDLYGRKCSSMSKSGIYVVNGKKVMVK